MLALLAIVLQTEGPADLSGHSAGRLGDTVIIAGALKEPSAWLYSISNKTWKQAPPMPERRVFSGYIQQGNKLILIGGMKGNGVHSGDVNAYDIASGKWSTLPPLPSPMTRVGACLSGGKLYVSGGYNGESDRAAKNSAQVLCFDFKKNGWTRLPSMPTPRHAHRLLPFQGRLWAVGGHGNNELAEGKVESFDPVKKTWRVEKPLPHSRGFFGCEVIGGKLVAFGSIDKLPHSVEWSATGWIDRSAADLPLRRFAYVKHGEGFLIFGGEPDGPLVQEYRP